MKAEYVFGKLKEVLTILPHPENKPTGNGCTCLVFRGDRLAGEIDPEIAVFSDEEFKYYRSEMGEDFIEDVVAFAQIDDLLLNLESALVGK